MELRPVRSQDWPLLRDLRLRALRDSPGAFGSTYEREERMREASDWQWWITGTEGVTTVRTYAIQQDEVFVGMATGMVETGQPHTAYLFGMWVEPDCRRRRLGVALLEAVSEWALESQCHEVVLRVVDGNDSASNFYRRQGFVTTSAPPEPLRVGSSVTAHEMKRQL
jgi:ribosomal protein S18 acetylase RimI-like enzyme